MIFGLGLILPKTRKGIQEKIKDANKRHEIKVFIYSILQFTRTNANHSFMQYWQSEKERKKRCYFTAIVSISIKALRGNPLTAKAARAGGSLE